MKHSVEKGRVFFLGLLTLALTTGCQQKREAEKQSLFLNLYCEPPSLDPRKASDATSVNVLIGLFEGLTRIGFDESPHPAMAEHIHLSNDHLTYTFTLRKAFWSDGAPVMAEDFADAWKKVLDPAFPSPFAYKLYMIENAEEVKKGIKPSSTLGIKVVDDKTLEVKLQYPTPYFLELTAFPTFFPVPHFHVEKHPNWAENGFIISNGPFRLKKWEHNDELIVEKNPHYWDQKNVLLQSIHFAMVDDTTTEFYMFEQGEIDWAGSPLSNLPVDAIGPLQKAKTLLSYPVNATYFYKINTNSFPCNNVNIRKALAYAINRKQITDHILQGGQIPTTSFIPSMSNWKSGAYFQDGNKEAARSYFKKGLQELGLEKKDFPLLSLSYNSNREHQKVALAIQQQWQDVLGVRVELKNDDWKSYLAKLNRMDYQIARSGWVGDFSDPVSFLNPYREKESNGHGGSNKTGWEHPLYQSLLKAASYETNAEHRAFLLSQAEEILMDEMPIIPLYHIVYSYLKKPHVKNVLLSKTGIADFKWTWIEWDEDS